MLLLPLQLPGSLAGIIGLVVLLIVIVAVSQSVVIVQATEKRTLTVFGKFRRLLDPGISFVVPFVSQTHAFDMRTQTLDVPSQEAITRDNSPVTADAVVYIRVMDAKKAFLEIEDYTKAVSNLAQTTLRAILGDMDLDDTLNKRQEINARIRNDLDEPTDEWGVRIESVEVREVNPSRDVVGAMEQQSSAERRRRAMILEAQGERRSAVESAEGDKQSNIIRAHGEKQAQILEAQGDSISTVLRAKSAESMGERAVLDKGMETLADIGQSDSTTFVLPQELTSLVGRYSKHLSGSDVAATEGDVLDSLDFDEETRDLLGIDDIEKTLNQLTDKTEIDVNEMGPEAEAIKDGEEVDIKNPNEVIEEVDTEMDSANPNQTGGGGPATATSTDTATPDAEDEWTTATEAEMTEPETTPETEPETEAETESEIGTKDEQSD